MIKILISLMYGQEIIQFNVFNCIPYIIYYMFIKIKVVAMSRREIISPGTTLRVESLSSKF